MLRHAADKRLVLVVLALSLTIFPACDFVTGVGDPDKAKADKKLAGHWTTSNGGNTSVLVTKVRDDGKTYDFEWITCEGTLDAPTKIVLTPLAGQAWVTEIGGAKFVTTRFERVPDSFAGRLKDSPYVILKLQQAEDSVTLTKLNAKDEDFLQAKTPAEMELAIKKHLDDTTAYDGTNELKRTTAEATKKVRDLAEAKGK